MASLIPPGYLSRHYTWPISQRHYTRPISQPPLHPDTSVAIIPDRSHSRHYTRPISQPPLYPADLTTAIIPGRSHSRHSTRSISQPQFYLSDVPPSPDISHLAPSAGWERRTIQLPRVDMSGSFDNAYPDSICGQ